MASKAGPLTNASRDDYIFARDFLDNNRYVADTSSPEASDLFLIKSQHKLDAQPLGQALRIRPSSQHSQGQSRSSSGRRRRRHRVSCKILLLTSPACDLADNLAPQGSGSLMSGTWFLLQPGSKAWTYRLMQRPRSRRCLPM
jgi:hypothetical protein